MLTVASTKEVRGNFQVISPVLFMTVEGEPMRFFVRPGQIKAQLQPYIKAGGGILCKDQEPLAILLFNPEDIRGLPENDAHRYVSIQYIRDCVEKNQQLDLEDYRLRPEDVQNCSANHKSSSGRLTAGRLAYTPEEDTAILKYVSKRKAEVGGNLLWQEMEKRLVTYHSWQSMKYHYKIHLANRQLEAEKEEKAEGETNAEIKAEEDEETQIQIPPCDKDAPPPPTHSADTAATDLKQTDAQPAPTESAEPDTAEAQTSTSPQPEVPCLQKQTDSEPVPAESPKPETTEPQTSSSLQPEIVPAEADSPPAQAQESLPDTPSQKKQKKTGTASPAPVQPQRRSKRRQLELEEPSGRQLRSSSSAAPQKAVPSPQPAKKAKTPTKPALQKAASPDKPASKRARGEREEAMVEIRQEENERDTASETAQADQEVNTVMEKDAENRGKKQKRKLGILEMATKEFEDGGESDRDETTEIENEAETAAVQPRSTEPPLQTSAASPQPSPARESRQEAEAPSSSHCPEPACPVTAPTDCQPSTSKAHLFIFESESQEEDSQSVIDKNSASSSVAQPVKNKDAAFSSLTQEQLEEDMQRIRGLMKQTNQDLVSVTKALLKTSGDFSAALQLLLNPSCFMGPFWNRHDDSLLQSADPVVQQQLLDKYGEEDVAKRLVFLEVER